MRRVALVRSSARSSGGWRWYEVVIDAEARTESCSCPSYTYGTGTDAAGRCKHLRAVADDHERIRWASVGPDGVGSCSCCGSAAVRGDESIVTPPPLRQPPEADARGPHEADELIPMPEHPGGLRERVAASRPSGTWAVSTGSGAPL